MDKLRIVGGRTLRGRVAIGGAKNAALPDLAAAILSYREIVLVGVPHVRDVRTMLRVLEHLGADVQESDGGRVAVTIDRIASIEAPNDLVKTMRASVLVLGPLVARHGRALSGICNKIFVVADRQPIEGASGRVPVCRRVGSRCWGRRQRGYRQCKRGELRFHVSVPQVDVTFTRMPPVM